jgi:hypothetical protein
MSTSKTDPAREALLPQLIEVLREKRLRTGELLQEAKIKDRRAGEDAVWMLLKRGEVIIGPDSTLRLTDDRHKAR